MRATQGSSPAILPHFPQSPLDFRRGNRHIARAHSPDAPAGAHLLVGGGRDGLMMPPSSNWGMDLDRGSSTTQEEVPSDALSTSEERKDHFIVRDGKEFAGTHLIVDLWGAKRIDELDHVEAVLTALWSSRPARLCCISTCTTSRRTTASPGVAVLAESHISIHSWPERDYAALDIFMCGDAQPHQAVEVAARGLRAELRGRHRASAGPVAVSEWLPGKRCTGIWRSGCARRRCCSRKNPRTSTSSSSATPPSGGC